MAYEFDTVGWEDWAGEVHQGAPSDEDLPEVHGMFNHFYDSDTGDSHYNWTYMDPPAEGETWDWDDWYDLIEGIAEDHGFAMA
jgi:hypothetical protein